MFFRIFFTKFWKFKKPAFFRYVKRLGITTVGMPEHGFTFPVGGIVPVIFSSMVFSQHEVSKVVVMVTRQFFKNILTNEKIA
jgi:hypothetical protein